MHWSPIPLPQTVREGSRPHPSSRARTDWLRNGHVATEIQSKPSQHIWGKFLLTPLEELLESVLFLPLLDVSCSWNGCSIWTFLC